MAPSRLLEMRMGSGKHATLRFVMQSLWHPARSTAAILWSPSWEHVSCMEEVRGLTTSIIHSLFLSQDCIYYFWRVSWNLSWEHLCCTPDVGSMDSLNSEKWTASLPRQLTESCSSGLNLELCTVNAAAPNVQIGLVQLIIGKVEESHMNSPPQLALLSWQHVAVQTNHELKSGIEHHKEDGNSDHLL